MCVLLALSLQRMPCRRPAPRRAVRAQILQSTIDLLTEMFAYDSSCSPIVFSHNDLQCGNILIHEQRPGLKFVDFEYRLPTLP